MLALLLIGRRCGALDSPAFIASSQNVFSIDFLTLVMLVLYASIFCFGFDPAVWFVLLRHAFGMSSCGTCGKQQKTKNMTCETISCH